MLELNCTAENDLILRFHLFSNQGEKIAFLAWVPQGRSIKSHLLHFCSGSLLVHPEQCVYSVHTHSQSKIMSIKIGELLQLYLPVILNESCLVCNGCQVRLGFANVWQSSQLTDNIVKHQLHEAQRLEIVCPCTKDLIQAFQVLLESTFKVVKRSCNLRKKEKISNKQDRERYKQIKLQCEMMQCYVETNRIQAVPDLRCP